MILYHTSDREIVYPDIHHGRKNADFGWGFYLTPDREFTYRWARDHAVVNEYEFDEHGLDKHIFLRDEEWFEYILEDSNIECDITLAKVIEAELSEINKKVRKHLETLTIIPKY